MLFCDKKRIHNATSVVCYTGRKRLGGFQCSTSEHLIRQDYIHDVDGCCSCCVCSQHNEPSTFSLSCRWHRRSQCKIQQIYHRPLITCCVICPIITGVISNDCERWGRHDTVLRANHAFLLWFCNAILICNLSVYKSNDTCCFYDNILLISVSR